MQRSTNVDRVVISKMLITKNGVVVWSADWNTGATIQTEERQWDLSTSYPRMRRVERGGVQCGMKLKCAIPERVD